MPYQYITSRYRKIKQIKVDIMAVFKLNFIEKSTSSDLKQGII